MLQNEYISQSVSSEFHSGLTVGLPITVNSHGMRKFFKTACNLASHKIRFPF